MSILEKRVKENLEVTVVADGKSVHTYGKGVLLGVENSDIHFYILGGNKYTIFEVGLAVYTFMAKHDLLDEFSEFMDYKMSEK